MAAVTFEHAEHLYPGATHPAVADLDLEIEDGEFMVLVGPSGCGKSTSLRMLAGLEEVTRGAIRIGDRDVSAVPPKDRDIAMVFQSYALYPHLSVADNMAFALKIAGVSKAERAARVRDAAALLDLEELLERKPKALSGGQRQRVAMGRAIVRQPQVFCMDEPLSNLDAKLRVSTRTQISSLQQRLGVTTVYVTHDQVEAMTMGDRVAVLHDGVLQQVDSPLALYDRPANLFVAGFIGSPAMNLLEARVDGDAAVVGGYRVPLPREVVGRAGASVTLGVRPESFRVQAAAGPSASDAARESDTVGLLLRVSVVEELGADTYLYGTVEGGTVGGGTVGGEPGDGVADHADVRREVIVRLDGRPTFVRGEEVRLSADPGCVHVFDTVTGERLSA